MKWIFSQLKKQQGFTLVELMVVVAIIGLLSAVAVPNFKKYQAKAKMSEAKLQLSAVYTAEVAFYSDYNMYGTCLRYMGYDPDNERLQRYYAVGFFSNGTGRNATASATAVASGLNLTPCPDTQAAVDGTNAPGTTTATYFLAGKGNGSSVINTQALANANAAGTAGTCTTNPPTGGNCAGDQAGVATQTFIAGAVGIISADAITGATASGLTIDNTKKISTIVTGY